MNQYLIQGDSTIAALSVPECKTLSRMLGYCALMGAEFHLDPTVTNGSLPVKSGRIRAVTPMRLPSDLSVGLAGLQWGPADDVAQLMLADNQATMELQNQERAIVNQGDFVCAVLPTGSTVSDQLVVSQTMNWPGGTVVFGTASQSAQEGVYDTPFSAAKAFTNFGSLTNIRGLVGAGTAAPVLPSTGSGSPVPATVAATLTAPTIEALTR